ncbi:MAG: hypothetical protein ABL886_00970 [Rhodoglobus sp.]
MGTVDDKIKDAIEASYYVSPERPGLTSDELLSVLARAGLQQGEIDVALQRLYQSDVVGTPQGLMFIDLPIWLTIDGATLTFNGDPRDRATAAYVQERLRDRARQAGLDRPLAQVSAIVAQGLDDGYAEDQVRLALWWLDWIEIVEVDATSGAVKGTQRTLNWGSLSSAPGTLTVTRREGFEALLAQVRAVIENRSPQVRRKKLLSELSVTSKITLDGEERQVLDDVLAHFADRGEGRSLDDTRRLMRTLDVHAVAHARLEPKNLLHSRSDATVVPSLIAIGQAPTLFAPLLLLLEHALRRAERFWEDKQMKPPLKGSSGLLWLSKDERTPETEKAMRQFELLLDATSLAPCLYPAPPSVDIRDIVATINTVPQLLRHKMIETEESWAGHARGERLQIVAATQAGPATPGLSSPKAVPSVPSLGTVVHLLNRFPHAARSLRSRWGQRAPLIMKDEYDVQYLLHALLLTQFEDVRPEEWTPSYAGASARMDFLLKREGVMVEVKMTRDGLDDRKLGEELVVDVHRYEARPDCAALVCLVYDPEKRLKNPAGLIADVERAHSRLAIRVVIAS